MYLCVCTRSSKTLLKFRHWRWNPEHRSRRAGAFADGLGSVFVRKGEPLGVRGMVTHGIFGFLRDLTITRSECELLVCMFDSVVLFACLRTCLSVGLLICWFVGLLASCLFVLCWLCWLRFLCMFVWGGSQKIGQTTSFAFPFGGPIGGNLFNPIYIAVWYYLFLFVDPYVWTHLLHVAGCIPLYFHSLRDLGCAFTIFHSFKQQHPNHPTTQPYLDASYMFIA